MSWKDAARVKKVCEELKSFEFRESWYPVLHKYLLFILWDGFFTQTLLWVLWLFSRNYSGLDSKVKIKNSLNLFVYLFSFFYVSCFKYRSIQSCFFFYAFFSFSFETRLPNKLSNKRKRRPCILKFISCYIRNFPQKLNFSSFSKEYMFKVQNH